MAAFFVLFRSWFQCPLPWEAWPFQLIPNRSATHIVLSVSLSPFIWFMQRCYFLCELYTHMLSLITHIHMHARACARTHTQCWRRSELVFLLWVLRQNLMYPEVGLALSIQLRESLNSWSSCLYLPSSGITGTHHHSWLFTSRFMFYLTESGHYIGAEWRRPSEGPNESFLFSPLVVKNCGNSNKC